MLQDYYDSRIFSNEFLMKSHILEAANALCQTRSWKSVTIQDICAQASISRPTFYRHFKNKADVGRWVISTLTAENFDRIGPDYSWEEALSNIAFACQSYSSSLLNDTAFFSDRGPYVLENASGVRSVIFEILRFRKTDITTFLEQEIELFSILYVNAFMECAYNQEWGGTMTSEEIGRLIGAFVPKDIKDLMINSRPSPQCPRQRDSLGPPQRSTIV